MKQNFGTITWTTLKDIRYRLNFIYLVGYIIDSSVFELPFDYSIPDVVPDNIILSALYTEDGAILLWLFSSP